MSVMGLDDLNINRVAQRPRSGFGETESQIDARGKIGRLTNGDLRSGRRQRLGLSARDARCTDAQLIATPMRRNGSSLHRMSPIVHSYSGASPASGASCT